jgi:hypothetical protein
MMGVVAVLRLCGLDSGDCLTPDFLALDTFPFRTFLDKSTELEGAALDSSSISTGEFVVVEPGCLCSKLGSESFWACRAGEVRGLKYAPGTVYCASTGKWASRGVTAGETSGVKAIYRTHVSVN